MKIGSEDEEDFLNKKEAKDCQEIKVKNHEVNNLFIFVNFFLLKIYLICSNKFRCGVKALIQVSQIQHIVS